MIKAYSLSKDGTLKLSPHFRVREFACKDGADTVFIDTELVLVLEAIRTHFGKAVTITSAYRTDTHNKKVGGVTGSQHCYGTAADIVVTGVAPLDVYNYADSILLTGGVGKYSGFTHVDVRAVKSRWVG